jgi:hypothetical protein
MDNMRPVALVVISGAEFLIGLIGHHDLIHNTEQAMD